MAKCLISKVGISVKNWGLGLGNIEIGVGDSTASNWKIQGDYLIQLNQIIVNVESQRLISAYKA